MALPKFSDIAKKDPKDQAPDQNPGADKPPLVDADPNKQQKPGGDEKLKQPSRKKEVDIGPVTGKTTMTGEPKDVFNPDPKKGNENLDEAANPPELPHAVVSWGRMNPPTVGHGKLVSKVKAIAKAVKADPHVYLTHSEDPKKNPLPYADKIKYAQKAFGDVIKHSNHKTLVDVMKNLQNNYHKITLVVGQDRVKEFKEFLDKYNGKDFKFKHIDVVSAGDRNPDDEGVEGMSASKLRDAAKGDDLEKFRKGLPKELHGDHKEIYDKLRKHMKIHEAFKNNRDECLIDITSEDLVGITEQLLKYATYEKPRQKSVEAIIREEIFDSINRLVG